MKFGSASQYWNQTPLQRIPIASVGHLRAVRRFLVGREKALFVVLSSEVAEQLTPEVAGEAIAKH